MSANYIDAGMLKKMFISGAYNLELNKDWINELNVFPVPDGDTGTNMTLTIFSAVNELKALTGSEMTDIAKAISHGSLRGARGNSGVILSQLLRGFSKEVQSYSEIDNAVIAQACERAVETAYKAVMKPKEGTILTVAKGIAKKASHLVKEEMDTADFILGILEEGKKVLERTPEMLPVLKEAGVVDSGGQGLIVIIEGAYKAFIGEEIQQPEGVSFTGTAPVAKPEVKRPAEEIKFGYCTEFIINIEKALPDREIASLKDFLESMGDSIVLVPDDDLIKIHVHTNEPGTVIQRAIRYGELSRIKINNMREEHREMLGINAEDAKKAEEKKEAAEERKPYGFITVAAGDGFETIYKDMGVDVVIKGGQTMNPSTEDFIKAIGKVNADCIFIYPNNKNIIMAANQARDLTEDKRVIVIQTKTVTQGITAMLNFAGDLTPEENAEAMSEGAKNVHTSQVTYSIRDTRVDDFDIKEGDIMAVGDRNILAVGKNINEIALESVHKIMTEDCELISIYYGEDYSEEDASKLAEAVENDFPDCGVELMEGGQPVYYCIISVE